MLDAVKILQSEAVGKLLGVVEKQDEAVFRAPTGSGKTWMMADFMNRVLAEREDVVFIAVSLSKSDLARQNHEKFGAYGNRFEKLRPYLIKSNPEGEGRLHVPADYNVYSLPRDLYKSRSILNKGAFLSFLEEMKSQGKQIWLIRDESHQATNNLDRLKKDYFTKTISFSATPKLKRGKSSDVEISDTDAMAARLIKRVEFGLQEDSLRDAMNKFMEVRERYDREGIGMRPCMIIQISNMEKADSEIREIMNTLEQREFRDLQWMLIVDDDRKCDTNNIMRKYPVFRWKDEAKKPNSTIDVIIFKMVITEGWDLPRACMLYQMRDAKSTQLTEQVIGRVRRNPRLLDFETLGDSAKELVTTAWVWGVTDRDALKAHSVRLAGKEATRNELRLKTTRLKDPGSVKSFDLKAFLSSDKRQDLASPEECPGIFELHRKYDQYPCSVRKLCAEYSGNDYRSWFHFNNNSDAVVREVDRVTGDYNESMVVSEEARAAPPLLSWYSPASNEKAWRQINEWLWIRTDQNTDKFSFDSESEAEWCGILLNLSKHSDRLVGKINTAQDGSRCLIFKNYPVNSDIGFEYYNHGIQISYPDFILKDFRGEFHLFEAKSLNKSNSQDFDSDEYRQKLEALKKCYAWAARKTGYHFWIPIKSNDDWIVYHFDEKTSEEGEIITGKDNFVKFVKELNE